MLATYKAILRGNQLEWHEQMPPQSAHQQPVTVYVTLLNEPIIAPEKAVQGAQMAAALTALANERPSLPQTIADPLTWEREQRQDRSLPQRPS